MANNIDITAGAEKVSPTQSPRMSRATVQSPELLPLLLKARDLEERGVLASGHLMDNLFTFGDIGSTYRGGVDLTQAIASLVQTDAAKETLIFLGQPNMRIAYQGLGIATGQYAFAAPFLMAQGIKQSLIAAKKGDLKGKLITDMTIAKDTALGIGGMGYLGFRPAALTLAATGSSLAGRVALGFGLLGNIGFSIMFLLLAIRSLFSIGFTAGFKSKLKAQGAIDKQLAFLQERLQCDPDHLIEKMKGKYEKKFSKLDESERAKAVEQAMNAELTQKAIEHGAQGLKQILMECGRKDISLAQCKKIVCEIAAAEATDLSEIGKTLKMQAWQAKKEAKMGRLLGGELVEKICSIQSENVSEEEAAQLVKEVTSKLNNQLWVHSFLIVVCALAIAGIVLGIVFTGGVGALVAIVISLIGTFAQLYLDKGSLIQTLSGKGAPGRKDKPLLISSIVLGAASFITVATLMATGVVSFGIVPLVVAIVLGTLWISYSSYTLATVVRKEKKHAKMHPTLEGFEKFLRTKPAQELIYEMYQRMPPEQQTLLYESLPLVGHDLNWKDWQSAAKRTIEKVEAARQERIKELNKLFDPYLKSA